jgi:hypothetical protein
MFCPHCGTRNDDAAVYCSQCGQRLDGTGAPPPADPYAHAPAEPPPPAPEPVPGRPSGTAGSGQVGALGVVFFCLPLVGAIMYFVWRDDQPAKARRACTLALWGMAVGIVLRILMALAGY